MLLAGMVNPELALQFAVRSDGILGGDTVVRRGGWLARMPRGVLPALAGGGISGQ
jgi:hypothetical protein